MTHLVTMTMPAMGKAPIKAYGNIAIMADGSNMARNPREGNKNV